MGKRHRGLKRELGGPPQAPEEADRARSKDGPTTLKGGACGGGGRPASPPRLPPSSLKGGLWEMERSPIPGSPLWAG